MKKLINGGWQCLYFSKISLKMKLTTILLLLSLFEINASTYSQNTKISLNLTNTEIGEVFNQIESVSEFRFLFESNKIALKNKVSLHANKKNISYILELLFKGTPVVYNTNDRQIILTINDSKNIEFDKTEINESTQTIQIEGNVTDNNNVPLPGVSILVKGTSNGVQTDFDGNYSIKVEDANAVLIFSYIGFLTQEISIDNRISIDVSLEEDVAKLDEVVVIGYGSLQKKDISSAIVKVNEEEFNKGNINDPVQLLVGKVAGLTVSNVGGSVTGNSTIRLRGLSSFGANIEPLIVIDGVIGGSLNNIDPNDIKSIDVLKDASAGAIYGTRGSSGVIIVTTKSGSNVSSSPKLDINYYSVFEKISNTRKAASLEDFLANNGVDYGYNTNWMDEVTQVANTNVINSSLSNNNGKTSYRVSLNHRDIEGVVKDENANLLNARINLVQKLFNDKLKLTGIISFTKKQITPVFGGEALEQATYWNPTAPVFVDGDPSKGYFETDEQNIFNPVAMNKENTKERKTKHTLINFKLDYEVLKGLFFSTNYSLQTLSAIEGFYSSSKSLVGDGYGLGAGQEVGGRAERFTSDSSDELIEFTGSYVNHEGDFEYTLLGGYGYQKEINEDFYATNTDFLTESVLWNNLGLGLGISKSGGAIAALGSSKSESLLASIFGRANFSFLDTYNMSFSYRREASSRFGANNRWGDFWAISGSVNVSKIIDLEFIDYLKFRGGYGVTGNVPNQRYAFLETLNSGGKLGYVDGLYIPAIEPTSNPNPDLKWEEKGELNIGVDYSLKRIITGSIDYYKRTTSNLLNRIDVPSPPNIYSSSLVNLGKLETNGIEASINLAIFNKKNFKWDLKLIYDTNKTRLVKFNNLQNSEFLTENLAVPGLRGTNTTLVKEGDVIGNIMAPLFSRFNEENKALVFDKDGNEILASQAKPEDFVVAGNGLPDFNFSISNSIVYKNFDLNFLWRGVFGHSLANLPAASYGHPIKAGMYRYLIGGFFNPDNKDDSVWHSKYVEDASFLKLDNATLGYNLNVKGDYFIDKVRIYASGNNLITLTKYSGADPEPRLIGNSGVLAPGYDRMNNYLPVRSFSFGINLNF